MANLDWEKLTPLQLGRYAEYYAKMEFASYGFEVYTSEVDDHGVDFVVKKTNGNYFDIQVKSIRGYNYIFFPKSKFLLRDNLYTAIVIFQPFEEPRHYLIPSLTWLNPNSLFVSHDYLGKKSPPEWGLNLSKKNISLLEPFSFDQVISRLAGL